MHVSALNQRSNQYSSMRTSSTFNEDDDSTAGLPEHEASNAGSDEVNRQQLELTIAFESFKRNAFTQHFLSHLQEQVDRLQNSATESRDNLTAKQLRSLLAQASTLKSVINYVTTPPSLA